MSKYYTTLKVLRDNGACRKRYDYLVSKIGDVKCRIGLEEILEHNGIEDAIWALCSVKFTNKYLRDWYNFKADCAEMVLENYEKQYPGDDRPRKAIEAARNYKDKSAAWSAWSARSAAWSAAWSAWSAAWSARSAESAVWSAAESAESAAWSAESAAESAESAAMSAGSAGRSEQEKLFIKYFC